MLELLAPAGGEASLRAAVQSGADAVYLGGPKFNARRGADNFSIDDIKKWVGYCHLYDVDVHAAVNTLIKENELPALCDYAYELNDAGVDAIIVQDIGAAELIHRLIPDMPLHASTQMTVTSLEGVRYLEDMGFSRVVLARELSSREIEYICAHAKAEIEVFVHGAICMCYSGQCLMSSILGGRSGNRGCCAQPCRLPYRISENGREQAEGYFLSPKDMALIDDLKELKRIGVSSLKIEGRLKRAEYVSAVVGIYRKYIDKTESVSNEDMRELENAFSRSGFTDGYFKAALGKDMMSHKNPGNASGNKFTEQAKQRTAENANIRKIPVHISAALYKGKPLEITIYDNKNNYASVSGTVCAETALNRPLDEERLKSQLLKLGSTPFTAEDVFAAVDENITVPVKEINEVRRKAADELIQMRQSRELGRKADADIITYSRKLPRNVVLTAEVNSIEQARAAVINGIRRIYAPSGIADEIRSMDGDFSVVPKMSDIFDNENTDSDCVMVSSPAAAAFYKDKRLYGDFRLNVFNSQTANHFRNFESVTLSPELNLGEIKEVLKNTDAYAEVIGYGRLPLMLMKNCPLKAAGKCQGKKQRYMLKDRKNEEFPVLCQKDCRAVLLNSKPVFMADKIKDLTKTGINAIRLVFTIEKFNICDKIIKEYKTALSGGEADTPAENTFTRGHYYRGVL